MTSKVGKSKKITGWSEQDVLDNHFWCVLIGDESQYGNRRPTHGYSQ